MPEKQSKTKIAAESVEPVTTAPKTSAKTSAKAVPAKVSADAKNAPELELAEVRTLTKMGKAKGNLTDEEIQGALSDIDLTESQYERVYTHFRDSGIEVVDELGGDDVTLAVVAGNVDATDIPTAADLDEIEVDAEVVEAAAIELPKVAPAKTTKKKVSDGADAKPAAAKKVAKKKISVAADAEPVAATQEATQETTKAAKRLTRRECFRICRRQCRLLRAIRHLPSLT